MKRASAATPSGRLELLLARTEFEPDALALAREHAASGARVGQRIRFGGRDAWLKAGPLRGRARARHALARLLLRAPPPRAREAVNLAWLEARLFQAATPLAAGWLGGGAPRWQFLVTAFVPAEPLDRTLRAESPAARALLLAELAREVARMHALHFVHRDLFHRNVLALGAGAARRLVFLDAWRGGERLQARGAAYDLACLFSEAASVWTAAESRAWLGAYAAERAALGSPAPRALWARAGAARAKLLARARREPGRWRLSEAPVQEFDFAAELAFAPVAR